MGWSSASAETRGAGGTVRMRLQVIYEEHLPALYLQEGGNSCTIMVQTILPKVQGHVIFKNWHLCRLCWEDCDHKICMFLPPPTRRKP